MEFYFNENYLIKSEIDRIESLKEIKDIYDILAKNNSQVHIKDNFDYGKIAEPKYSIAYGLFKRFKIISCEDCEILESTEIKPYIDNLKFVELVSLCLKNSNDKVFSNSNENEAVADIYEAHNLKITNLIGINSVKDYLMLNPTPKSMREVFERVSNQFQHIKFSNDAYKTADARWELYSKFGLERVFTVFRVLETLVYPFLKGNSTGSNEKDIMYEFKRQTNGIEFSDESSATMRKYAKQRTVTVNGRKLVMSYHVKVADNRIYFKYDSVDDCIYIGHSGGHLYTINYKGN